jgi:hypothetical protein
MTRLSIGAEPIQPVRFAKADAEFHELLSKRLLLAIDRPFADLSRSVTPIPAPVDAPATPAEIQTARAD